MAKFLVIVRVQGLCEDSPARENMSGDETLIWSDEIVQSNFRVGDSIRLTVKHPDIPADSYNGKLDKDLDGRAAVINQIYSEEESAEWLHVHRPYVGEIR